ncbi:MAG: hemerythrin domain-containing protein [Comamonadaceae bacterium]
MSAAPLAPATGFEAQDACHRQILAHLSLLNELALHIDQFGIDEDAQRRAGMVESFFSGTSRQHHADEEKNVFPPLLGGSNAELAELVKVLQQDHCWIEEDWLELAPQLRAIASGNNWIDSAEFQHNAEIFLTLTRGHIELEEKMIYPEVRALKARAASRTTREPL